MVNHYNKSSQEFKKIDKDVTKLSGGTYSIGFDRELLENLNWMKINRYENAIFGLRPIEAIQAGKEIDTLFIQKGLKNELFQELWQ